MTTYSIIPFIALLAYIPLFALVVWQRPWQRQHKLLAFYLITAIVWSLITFLLYSPFLVKYSPLLAKAHFVSTMWMATHYYHFIRNFGYKPGDFGVKFGYSFVLLFIVLAALDYIPKSISIAPDGLIFVDFGPYLWLLVFPMLFLIGLALFALIKKLHISNDPKERNRILYLFAGISTLTLFSLPEIMPATRAHTIEHLGNLINAAILTYATLRHELVTIRFLARRGLVYIGCAIMITGVYLLILSFLVYGLRFKLDFASVVIATITAGILLGAFWYPMQRVCLRLVDWLLYGKHLGYRIKMLDFARHMRGILSLENMGEEVTRIVAGFTGARAVGLFIQKEEDFVCEFVFPETESKTMSKLKLRQDSPIVAWLSREGKYLARENIDILPEFSSLWQEERKAIAAADIEYFFPLIARDKLVAILALTKAMTGVTYDIGDINLLQNLTNQVAIMISNAQLYAASQKLGEELQLVNRLTQIITSSLNIDEVYEKFIQELRKTVAADWAAVCLIEGNQLRFFALSALAGSAWRSGETIPLEGTGTQYVAKTKKTLMEEDLLKHHRFWTGKIHIEQGIRSIVYTPLVVRGEGIGALVIGSRKPNAYGSREINLLEQVSGQLATAIENFQLYCQVQQKAITDELTGVFNRRYFEERLTEEINRHTRYGGVFSIIMLDLDFFKAYNDTYGHQAGDRILREIGQKVKELVRAVDLCFRYGGDEFALILPQTSAKEAYQVAERVREQVSKEMKAKGIVITLSSGIASWPADGTTSDELVRAADNALFYAKQTGGNWCCLFSSTVPSPVANRHRFINEKLALSIVQALCAAADAKDHYIYSHSRKVAIYATALAEAIGLPEDKVAIINTAALLHDVGKIGVPDQILNKPSKLTAEEWESVKNHSVLGINIISYIPELAPCLPIILHHHERYDGQGYPQGLKAEESSLEARILAIADAFAAMTSSRPYRPALSYQEAVEELRKGANTQFDPELVEKFIPIALSLAPPEETPTN